MLSRRTKKKRLYGVDPLYQSILVCVFLNHIIQNGKKSLAYHVLYSVLQKIQEKTQRQPLAILEYAVRIVTPSVQLKARRVGGTTYQVPIEVEPRCGTTIAIRWLLIAARSRPERNIVRSLSAEIMDAARGQGAAIQKREEVHRMAEANKAFVRYRF